MDPRRGRRYHLLVSASLAVALAGVLVLAACSGTRNRSTIGEVEPVPTSDSGRQPTAHKIGFQTQTVRLPRGATLVVEDPHFSPGIGDRWDITVPPDPSVVTVVSGKTHDCNQPGCTGRWDYTIEAKHAGTTTMQFQYCYRSAPGPSCMGKEGRAAPAPVVLTVVVT